MTTAERLLERALAADLHAHRDLRAGEVDRGNGDVDLALGITSRIGMWSTSTSYIDLPRPCRDRCPGSSSGCPAGRGRSASTRWPDSAKATARFRVVVVFATPPFWLANEMIFARRSDASPMWAPGACRLPAPGGRERLLGADAPVVVGPRRARCRRATGRRRLRTACSTAGDRAADGSAHRRSGSATGGVGGSRPLQSRAPVGLGLGLRRGLARARPGGRWSRAGGRWWTCPAWNRG